MLYPLSYERPAGGPKEKSSGCGRGDSPGLSAGARCSVRGRRYAMERRCQVGRAAALLVGAMSALTVEEFTRKRLGSARVELAALGLVTAAAIYPAMRREQRTSGPALREAATVAGATALSLAGRGPIPGPRSGLLRRGLLAAGWVGHAAF